MEILSNGILTASINPKGAELTSLVMDGIERIWEGDPEIWARHSPLLFPVIGRLDGQSYQLNGKTYHIPTHGFCRDRQFEVVEKSDTHILLRTQEDAETLAVYPFFFTLEVEFTLEGSSILKRHTVTNHTGRNMPFELGGHDAYRTTLMPGEVMEDYRILFEGLDHLEPYGMEPATGMLTLPKGCIPLEDGALTKLPIDVGLDTIIVNNLPVRKATLVSIKSPRTVTVEFDDFAYLGIWTAQVGKVTNYICIEPWTTLPDGHFVGPALRAKFGIQTLEPEESKSYLYRTTFE